MVVRIVVVFMLFCSLVIEQPILIERADFWAITALIVGGVCSIPLWSRKWLLSLSLLGIIFYFHLAVVGDVSFSIWLFYYGLILEAYRVAHSQKRGSIVAVIVTVSFLPYVFFESSSNPFIAHLLFVILTVVNMMFMTKSSDVSDEKEEQWQQLLNEYRILKRQLYAQEQQTREEERTRIARDIHDSVGHQLTALMMQLEMLEIQVDDEKRLKKEQLSHAKQLARASLNEMRSAVKDMREEDIKGVASVLHLIRKLEAESHIRVQLTTKSGALSALLSNEQNMAVYRFIQEGLTNAMRHAHTREIEVVLEVIGERHFSVTMSNASHSMESAREGFGIRSLRERFELLGGRFLMTKTKHTFTIHGQFPLEGQRMQ